MRYSKNISNLLLFLLTISIIVYPQAGISTITVYAHPAPSEIKLQQDQLFSYESVLTLLEEIEDGVLDERCTLKELDRINHFLANLAIEGILPDELDEAFALESDIQKLLNGEQSIYEYASWQPNVSYGLGEIVLCKSVFHKVWDKTRKFAKKHKKKILIGTAIAVGVLFVVGVIIVASGASAAAAAGAAGAVGALGAYEEQDKNEIPPINIPEISEITDSSMLQEVFQEEASTFKEWIVNEQFLNTDFSGFPLEESGKILKDAFVHQSLENLNEHFSHEFGMQSLLIDEPFDVYQQRGARALELHYYDQAISDFGKSIELNPNNHEAYLDRATVHLRMGAHELSLEDYLQYSAKKPTTLEHVTEFSLGFAKGLPRGAKESGSELCSFAKQCVIHPINTAEEIGNAFVMLGKLAHSQQWSTIGEALAPEVHELITKWDTFSPREQGELAGYAFGKHGADLLIPGAATKLVSAGIKGAKEITAVCKTLKNAEKTLALEALAQSAITVDKLVETGKVISKTALPNILENTVAKVMGNSYKAVGEVTVPIKNVELANFLNTLSEGNWIKVYEAGIQNGSKIEIHYFRNNTTGNIFDVKVKYDYFHQKEFKELIK